MKKIRDFLFFLLMNYETISAGVVGGLVGNLIVVLIKKFS